MQERFTFTEKLAALQKAKVDMPRIIATEGQNYFKLNFRKQQSPDGVAWAKRKQESERTKNKRVTKNGGLDKRFKGFKPLLVNTGYLRDSMSDTIISYDYKRIVWGVKNVDYAGYLNYGTEKMVARPFLADGKEIRGKIKGIIKREFDKIMKAK